MKHNYLLKKLALATLIIPFGGFSQSLVDVQCNINLEYTSITDTVPDWHLINYDGGINYISDGDGDMYDDGNYLNTNLATDINYSDDIILASTDFGPNGQYFTRELPGFFMLAADIDSITDFSISGNLGADGSGSAVGHELTLVVAGTSYDLFMKQVYGDGDPSVNHFIIIPSNPNASHSFPGDTDDDQHDLTGIEGSTRLYYFLVASDPDQLYSVQEVTDIATTFLNAINGGGSLGANATETEVCDGEMVTLTGSGGTGYVWNNGVTDGTPFAPPLGTTSYGVSAVGTNGCNNVAGVEITVLENPDVTLSTTDVLLGGDGSIYLTLNGGIFPFTYDWDNDGTGDFDDDQNLVNQDAGTYTVVVEHGNGCTTTETATINSQVTIGEIDNNKIDIFPNPATNEFTIRYNGQFNFSVSNINGQKIVVGTGNQSELISLENFTQGTYIVTVNNEHSVRLIKH